MRPSHLLLWRSSEAVIRELFLLGVRRESSKAGSHSYLGIRDAWHTHFYNVHMCTDHGAAATGAAHAVERDTRMCVSGDRYLCDCLVTPECLDPAA